MLRPNKVKTFRDSSGLASVVSWLLAAIVPGFLHLLTVALLFGCILFANWIFGTTTDQSNLHPVESFGYLGCFMLYFLRCIPCLSIPFAVTNILETNPHRHTCVVFCESLYGKQGVVSLDCTESSFPRWLDQTTWKGILTMGTFPPAPKLSKSRTKVPFLCFRVVTRGLFPDLVRNNVERNMQTCYKVGLDNFKFEVVTDSPLHIPKSSLVRELVVPSNYVTKNNSLFKARALHYCNEPAVNILSNDDWVVHLDEETLLTEASAVGLANFASLEQADVGQGVITYANEEVVNWCTTLADSVRVSVDFGMMRFCFRQLGYPLMGFKGSFIITRESLEKEIGFDFGPKGSVAEDAMFALVAWSKGYKFGFVEGEMWEKSPFSLVDFIKQRKRWFVGHMYILLNADIPLRCKLGMIPTDLGWFLLAATIVNIPVSIVFPIPLPLWLIVVANSIGGLILFMFVFGSIKSFSLRKYGVALKTVIIFANILVIPLVACLDAAASIYGFWTRNSVGFHIVNKETTSNKSYNNNGDTSMTRNVV